MTTKDNGGQGRTGVLTVHHQGVQQGRLRRHASLERKEWIGSGAGREGERGGEVEGSLVGWLVGWLVG